MTIALFKALTILAFSNAATDQPLSEAASGIEYASPQAAEEALRAKPGIEMREENGWLVFTDTPLSTFWSIALRGNPAYPSVVKRTLVENDGGIDLEMSVMCGASKVVCDDMVGAFQENTEQIKASFKQK